MSKENKVPTSLSVMLGKEEFEAKEKIYTIKPIALIDSEEFMKAGLILTTHIFLFGEKGEMDKIDRWLGGAKDKEGKITKQGYCFDENNKPVTLQKAMEDGWDVVDLRNFFNRLAGFSG